MRWFHRKPSRHPLEQWAVLVSNGREVSSRTPYVLEVDNRGRYTNFKQIRFAWVATGVTVTHFRVIDADGAVTDLPV